MKCVKNKIIHILDSRELDREMVIRKSRITTKYGVTGLEQNTAD